MGLSLPSSCGKLQWKEFYDAYIRQIGKCSDLCNQA